MKKGILIATYIIFSYCFAQQKIAYSYIERLSILGKTSPVSANLYPPEGSDKKSGLEIDYNFFGESPVKCPYHFYVCSTRDSLIYLANNQGQINFDIPVAVFNESEIRILEPTLLFACAPDSGTIILKKFDPNNLDPQDYQDTDAVVPVPEKVVLDFADENPSFPGGQVEMQNFISQHLTYPTDDTAAHGTVFIQFVVNADGSITDIVVAKGLIPSLDQEAIRLVSIMPKWIPGTQAGKVCNVRYTIPIKF